MTTTNKRRGHPFQLIADRSIKLEEGEDFALCFDFVSDICQQQCRDQISGHGNIRSCECLFILKDNAARQSVARYNMVAFNDEEKQHCAWGKLKIRRETDRHRRPFARFDST